MHLVADFLFFHDTSAAAPKTQGLRVYPVSQKGFGELPSVQSFTTILSEHFKFLSGKNSITDVFFRVWIKRTKFRQSTAHNLRTCECLTVFAYNNKKPKGLKQIANLDVI